MNGLCYEYFQDGVCLNSIDCVFVYEEVRCTSKTEIKYGLCVHKTLSLTGDIIIYTPEDLVIN